MKTESEFNREPLRLSLAAAATMDLSEIDGLSVDDLDLCDADLNRAARVWLWLCDVTEDSAGADRVRREVLTDGGLIAALSLPAPEFLRWFRAARWEEFDSTERTGSEAWAWAVLQRAWAACEAFGPLAVQRRLTGLP